MEKQSITGAIEPRMTATEFAETFYKVPALITHGVRCGKVNCRCAASEYRHPCTCLFWRDGRGRLRRRYVRKAEVEDVRSVIELRQAIARERRQAVAESNALLRDLRCRLRELKRIGKEHHLW